MAGIPTRHFLNKRIATLIIQVVNATAGPTTDGMSGGRNPPQVSCAGVSGSATPAASAMGANPRNAPTGNPSASRITLATVVNEALRIASLIPATVRKIAVALPAKKVRLGWLGQAGRARGP